MPVYDYWCDSHGPFEGERPMAEFDQPCACPVCGQAAPRVMINVPKIFGMSREVRRAHETNERAADSPKRLSAHGPGCPCCSGSAKKGRATLNRADGSKSFPTARPWMISH